jgi:hypothetical protein
VLAAVVALATSFASIARAADFTYGDGIPPLVSPSDLVRELASAGSAVPVPQVLAAWARYLGAWDEAVARLQRERGSTMDGVVFRSDGPLMGDPEDERSSRRRALAVREVHRALLASLFRDIDPSGADAGVANVRALRRMQAIAEAAQEFDWSEAGLRAQSPEGLVVSAFGDDPARCAAALATLADSRDSRASLGERALKESEGANDARRAVLREVGLDAVTRAQYFEAMMALRAEDSEDGDPEGEPAAVGDAGAEAPKPDPALVQKAREWTAAIQRAWMVGRRVGASARCDFMRAQWKAFLEVYESFDEPSRYKLFRAYWRGCISDSGDGGGGLRDTGLLELAAHAAADAGCRRCVREAVERWRKELPALVFAEAGRAIDEARARLTRADDAADAMEREYEDPIGELVGELGESLRERCAEQCPDEEARAESAPDWSLVSDIPEGAELVREEAQAEVDAEEAEADPFADDWKRMMRRAGVALPVDREWLLRAMRLVASGTVDEVAVGSLLDAYEARWDDRVMTPQGRADGLRSELPWAPDGVDAAVDAAEAECRRERDAADAELLDACIAIVGASDADAELVRLARSLGDARSEDSGVQVEGLRVNSAEAVLSAELPAAQRAAALEVIRARAPAMRETLRSVEACLARWRTAQSSCWNGVMEAGFRERVELNKERMPIVAGHESRWRDARRAMRASFDGALQATVAAVEAVDAAGAASLRAIAERRAYPELFRPEEEIRRIASHLLELVPAEDLALRESIAAAADEARDVAVAGRRSAIAARRGSAAASVDDLADPAWAAASASIGASTCRAQAALSHAAERLRVVAPQSLRAKCPAWRWFCRQNQVSADDFGARLDSAP